MNCHYYFAKNAATGQRRIVNTPYHVAIGTFVIKQKDDDFYADDGTCRFAGPTADHFRVQAETSEQMFNFASAMALLGKESELWGFAEQMQAAEAASAARHAPRPH